MHTALPHAGELPLLRAAAPALRLGVVGGARPPRTIQAAIYEGQMAARAL